MLNVKYTFEQMKENIMTLVRSIFPQSFLYKLRSFNTTNCDQG